MNDREYDTSIAGLDMSGYGPLLDSNLSGPDDHMNDAHTTADEYHVNKMCAVEDSAGVTYSHPESASDLCDMLNDVWYRARKRAYSYGPLLNDADVVAAVRGAADESDTNSTRIGAPGSEIREKYATQAAMLYAAAARLEALLKAAQDAQ